MVIRLEESEQTVDLDCFVSANPASGSFCHWRPLGAHLSKVVGEDSRRLSSWALFYGFLGGISIGDSARTAHSRWERVWRNGARRTMEQHLAATLGTVCPKNFVVFKERCNARNMFIFISASLQQ